MYELVMAVAKEHGLDLEPRALARAVANLSESYNTHGDARDVSPREALAARLAFFFIRDAMKAEHAVRELASVGLLKSGAHVLDLGAGLGASTVGVMNAVGSVTATWLDTDAAALDVGQSIAARLKLTIERRTAPIDQAPEGTFDLVVLGQVLVEVGATTKEHAAFLERLLARSVAPSGSLVVIEPALRDRSRMLHAVRDCLRESVTIFAPCTHSHACPALAAPKEWCHEDRDVDLPEPLAAIARAAGLRWQGLTFSYLVLRNDKATLASLAGAHDWARCVSPPLVSKGKTERILCTLEGQLVKTMRTNRDRAEANEAWDAIEKGDLVATERQSGDMLSPSPPPQVERRIRAETHVRRWSSR